MNTNSGAAAPASGRKRPRAEGAAPKGAASPLPSEIDDIVARIRGLDIADPRRAGNQALLSTLKDIEVLKAKNAGLEAQQASCQPGQPDWNALQGAIIANNATLQTLREQEEKRRAEISRLTPAAHGGGGAGAAASEPMLIEQRELQPFVPQSVGEEKDRLVRVGHLNAAGLAGTGGGILLYMRDEAKELKGALGGLAGTYRGAYVSGPPGTGKSSVAWLWACERSTQESVMWIHIDEASRAFVVVMPKGRSWAAFQCDLVSSVGPLFRSFQGTLVVFDGMTADLRKKGLLSLASIWSDAGEAHRLIVISSLQMFPRGETLLLNQFTEIEVGSWSKEEFEAALALPQFRAQVQANIGEDFENKYFFAGSSARWMFGLSMSMARTDISKWISNDVDASKLLSGVQGPTSEAAVNHLVQRWKVGSAWRYSIVSEFVGRELAEKCELQFVRAAQMQARDNSSFQGWVYEMAFLTRLRLCGEQKEDFVVGEENWTVPRRLRYDAVRSLKGDLVQEMGAPERYANVLGVQQGDWLVPRVFNQGGFDLAQVLPYHRGGSEAAGTSVRVVQCSRASEHSLKLEYVVELIGVLGEIGFVIEKVDFVFVVPQTRAASFSVNPPTGDMRTVLNHANRRWRYPAKRGVRDRDFRVVVWDL